MAPTYPAFFLQLQHVEDFTWQSNLHLRLGYTPGCPEMKGKVTDRVLLHFDRYG